MGYASFNHYNAVFMENENTFIRDFIFRFYFTEISNKCKEVFHAFSIQFCQKSDRRLLSFPASSTDTSRPQIRAPRIARRMRVQASSFTST